MKKDIIKKGSIINTETGTIEVTWEEPDWADDQAAEMIGEGLFDAAVELMDDEIREEIHAELAPCTDEEFLAEYIRRHQDKFGETFKVN